MVREAIAAKDFVKTVAASIASLIAMAGDRAEIAENATLVVHAPWAESPASDGLRYCRPSPSALAGYEKWSDASDLCAKQFLGVAERDLFLVFTRKIDCSEPVGPFFNACERIVGSEHHAVHADVLQ